MVITIKQTLREKVEGLSVITASSHVESYIRCVEYGKAKAHYKSNILLGKAILAGFFVGVCAHAAGIGGGLFFYHKLREIVGTSVSTFVYSFTFPVALLCIVCTGSDLFTGNTMAVTTALLERKICIVSYLRVMAISLIGNYIGAVFSAFVVSYGSGAFAPKDVVEKNHIFLFLNYMAVKKVNHTFVECVSLAIGCNIFVCLAVYFVLTIRDGAGLVFSVFFAVFSFAIAGYEHIIANMYTLNLALMVKANVSFVSVYAGNLLPTLIGNYIAGAVILALPLHFFYRHNYESYDATVNESQNTELKDISIPLSDEKRGIPQHNSENMYKEKDNSFIDEKGQ